MKTIRPLTVVACLIVGGSAQANHGEPHPPQFPEDIDVYTVFELPAASPQNVYEVFYESEVVANHQQRVVTASDFFNGMSTEPANVTFWFAWRDPAIPNSTELSDPYT